MMLIHVIEMAKTIELGIKISIKSLVQISVALDGTNGGEIFMLCASANVAVYAIEMKKVEVNSKMVSLLPECYQLFSKNNNIAKIEVELSSNSPGFIVFHYYLHRGVDAAH